MWEAIQRNRRRSVLVVTILAIVLIAVGIALGVLMTGREDGMLLGGIAAFGLWVVLWITMRSRGDDILLRMAHAREIQKRDHPQLVNVVEEMSIAAALPSPPRIFVVDDPAPNAFAVGRRPEKAAVAVTIGLLTLLDRDELQGVVAHEIGHIKNRDVALMTTAGIMVGAIVLLVEIGLRVLWWGGGARSSRDSSGGGGGAQAIMMIVGLVFLLLAPLLAQLIYFALSRRREYLADASGAMFTRWPEGLASALEKLGKAPPLVQADKSRVTAPMYIVRPIREGEKRALSSTFATHPPLAKRIAVLRAMGGGADYRAYDQAYGKVTGRHVVGQRTLALTPKVEAEPPTEAGPALGPTQRLRHASNAYLAASGYETKTCPSCGAVVKIPPMLRDRLDHCPRCGASWV
ncbi:MAG: M48 family metalloprotease [Planctomycetota bacterium]